MENPTDWQAVVAMIGVDPAILRAAARPWAEDPTLPPITLEQLIDRITAVSAIAAQLNDTNITEHHFIDQLDPADIPPTMGSYGIPRLASDTD